MFYKKNKEIVKILQYIKNLKNKERMQIIDVHQHPYDVMGVVHPSEYSSCEIHENKKYNESSILEFFEYGKIVSIISPLLYKIVPQYVHSTIRQTYKKVCQYRLIREMDVSLIDKAFLLPINPWVDTKPVIETYTDKRFFIFHSPDIHNKSKNELKDFGDG